MTGKEIAIGQKFGKLTVLSEVETRKSGRHYLCQCDCGEKAIVMGSRLRRGDTRSCGCLRKLNGIEHRFKAKHGMNKERIYNVWHRMIDRCEHPNSDRYEYYGARGIKVCQEWHDVRVFAEWAYAHGYDKDAPRGKTTIDRIDVNGNYEPDNCRIVDMKTQCNNRRKRRTYDRKRNLQPCIGM